MTNSTSQLHTVLLNVRAKNDVYSAMPIRVLKAVADTEGVSAVLASLEENGGYLRRVEGRDVRIIKQSGIEGLVERAANLCSVLLVDVPVDPDDLAASAPIVNAIRTDAEASGVRVLAYTMEGGDLLKSPDASHCGILIGRLIVSISKAEEFDLLRLRLEDRFPLLAVMPNDHFDQPGRPILTYVEDDPFGAWVGITIRYNSQNRAVRYMLDKPKA